jgi:hypothetical protein
MKLRLSGIVWCRQRSRKPLCIHWKQQRTRGGFGNPRLTRIIQLNNEDLTLQGLMAIVAGAFAVELCCAIFGSTHDERTRKGKKLVFPTLGHGVRRA